MIFRLQAEDRKEMTGEFLQRTLQQGDITRSYTVHLPLNAIPTNPVPVLFILHGGDGGSPRMMSEGTGYNKISDRENFIAVYPSGVDGQWNDGRGKTFRRKDNSGIDDVDFIKLVIEKLSIEFPVDAKRVYIMGVSNGGMMAYRLAIELGDRIAAIASVIANLPANLASIKPVRPIPVLVMNGTKDPLIPWEGGPIRILGRKFGELLSTQETVDFWVKANGLDEKVKKEILPDSHERDGCMVEVASYGKEGSNVPVLLYAINGGGHQLPGSKTYLRYILLGKKCMDINGSEEIWNFLKQHSLGGFNN
jgi:polyhydroxybutyrate depolymerase